MKNRQTNFGRFKNTSDNPSQEGRISRILRKVTKLAAFGITIYIAYIAIESLCTFAVWDKSTSDDLNNLNNFNNSASPTIAVQNSDDYPDISKDEDTSDNFVDSFYYDYSDTDKAKYNSFKTEYSEFKNPTLGVLTSSFGNRNGRQHQGIDIGADYGTEIFAAKGGTVIFSGTAGGYGNYIKIDHGNGFETAYGHCQKLLVNQGDNVNQGQLIAYMGSTGNSTGPHLHFEIKQNGEYINPLDYVIYRP